MTRTMCGTVSSGPRMAVSPSSTRRVRARPAFQGTRAYATNPNGTITGFFIDTVNAVHGYVRSNQGVITVFDAPGAGTGPFPEGTFPFSPLIINPERGDRRMVHGLGPRQSRFPER